MTHTPFLLICGPSLFVAWDAGDSDMLETRCLVAEGLSAGAAGRINKRDLALRLLCDPRWDVLPWRVAKGR